MRTKKLTCIALFAAIAAIVMYIEFPIPFMPPFLKIDFSGVVILIGAMLFGTKPAVAMIFIKDALHLLRTQTAGVGELADFIMLTALVIVFMSIYKRSNKKLLLACIVSVLVMSVLGVFVNMYLLIPFYKNIMPIEAIISACAAINPYINTMEGYYLFGVLPFNLIKGFLITLFTTLVYPKLSRVETFK